LWNFSPFDLITVNSFRYACWRNCWRALLSDFPFSGLIGLGMGDDYSFLKKIQGSLDWV